MFRADQYAIDVFATRFICIVTLM